MSFLKNNQVERILDFYPKTRGNDKLLILKVWEMFDLVLSEGQRKLFLSDRIPSTETITRTRRKLQEEGKYLPSAAVVIERQNLANNYKQEAIQDRQLKMLDVRYVRRVKRIFDAD